MQSLPDPENYSTTIYTDNLASHLVLSTGAGKDSVLCSCAREIWKFAVFNNCDVFIVHKPRKQLKLVDALGRQFHDTTAYNIATNMCTQIHLTRTRISLNDTFLDDTL